MAVCEKERERLQKHMPSVCVCILCINRIIFRQSGADCQNIHCSLKHRWQAIFRYTMANTNTYQATLFAMNLNILLASMVSLVWLGLAMTFTDSFRIDLSWCLESSLVYQRFAFIYLFWQIYHMFSDSLFIFDDNFWIVLTATTIINATVDSKLFRIFDY